METLFGIRSDIPANTKLKNGYVLFDWIMRQRGIPAFWGRSLSGENPLTQSEIDFLKSKDCKIMLIMDDLTEEKISATDGTADAVKATDAAKAIGVPQNDEIAIFADIKDDWSVNHNWMLSFARTLQLNGYITGFIGNTDSSKNFNFDRQCSHYVQAAIDEFYNNTIYCATEPKLENEPDEWCPYCPSELQPDDIRLWMTGTIMFDGISVDVVYAKDEKMLANTWKGGE